MRMQDSLLAADQALPVPAMLSYQQKRPSIPEVYPSVARPSSLKTRRFPRPSREGIGFVGNNNLLL
jgi:hypothetical protein